MRNRRSPIETTDYTSTNVRVPISANSSYTNRAHSTRTEACLGKCRLEDESVLCTEHKNVAVEEHASARNIWAALSELWTVRESAGPAIIPRWATNVEVDRLDQFGVRMLSAVQW